MKRLVLPLRWVFALLISTAAVIPGARIAEAPDSTLRVLFVGNSYTYYNSLPQLVKAMAEDAFPSRRVETKFVGAGGATLEDHWDRGHALEEIQSRRWDYVVLQGQSMLGSAVVEDGEQYFSGPDQFFRHAKLFDQTIRASGAETLLFMTWSRRDHREQQKYLTFAYMTVARELRSKIAPVGLVWDVVRDDPTFDLYDLDGSHPSIYGSYLAAVTIVTALHSSNPTNLSGYLEGREILKDGLLSAEMRPLSQLTDEEVKIIQDATAKVFEQLKRNGGYLDVEEAIREREPSPSWIRSLARLGTAEGQAAALLAGILIFFAVRGWTAHQS